MPRPKGAEGRIRIRTVRMGEEGKERILLFGYWGRKGEKREREGKEMKEEEEKDKRTDVLFWRADDADIGSRELCPEVVREGDGSVRHRVAHNERRPTPRVHVVGIVVVVVRI